MSENRKDPRCPYCGSEMNENLFAYGNGGGWCNFECPNCGATSPKKENSESCNKAEFAAYFVAKKRWQEPNRVLTLEEVLEIVRQNADGYNHICWLEKVDVRCISTPGFLGGYGIHSEIYVNFDFYEVVTEYPDCVPREGYGKTWRCWMRNPTAQEMAETPWEGEAGDRHDE